jgi:hypothetical protein
VAGTLEYRFIMRARELLLVVMEVVMVMAAEEDLGEEMAVEEEEAMEGVEGMVVLRWHVEIAGSVKT